MTTFCSHCGGVFSTKKDGTIRAHKRHVSGGTYYHGPNWVPCEGSGKPPKILP